MLTWYKADLHIHTCLSPCGELTMSPRKIMDKVRRDGIDLIAICDHNTAANVHPVMEAAGGMPVTVLPGLEICTREEIHLLAIFGQPSAAADMQEAVYARLSGRNNPEVFGLQVLASGKDEVEGYEERLLIGAADIGIDEAVQEVHRRGGLAVASHVDRESFSIISQLGFVPEKLGLDALEISRNTPDAGTWREAYPGRTFLRNSDAHTLEDIGSNTSEYLMAGRTFGELVQALRSLNGRSVRTN